MKKRLVIIVIIVLAFCLGVFGTLAFLKCMSFDTPVIDKKVSITEKDSIKESIDKVYDAVVVIEGYNNGQMISVGTGFAYKQDNKKIYIITNHHVIEKASDIKITNMAGKTVDAKLLGSDEFADIAVLSVDKDKALKTVEIGSTEKASLGDTVFTVGSPMGKDYKGTVTKGILSGKDRGVTVSLNSGSYVMEVLQTDAAINPGNSGGPLFDINGKVIGVISMKLVKDEIEGMGFALPIEIVMSSVEKLEKGETLDRPIIGVEILDIDNPYALLYNRISIDDDIKSGVVIVRTEDDYPASESGLKKGDVIIGIDNKEIKNSAYLRSVLYKHNIGDKITVKYIRDGKQKETEVTLDKGAND